ncbi:maltoporin LamB [Psychromonas sp. MME2]|uniref:maltoporin n=1 Tax=Psychromonas sp. MME2 TaxID=3231033 RepID=UPI00339BC9E7
MKIKTLSAAVAVALLSASASAVDFNGYMRAGIGQNTDGGNQVCAQANGAPTKYRLGNECESYLELGLGQDLYEKDGKKFRLNTMVAIKAGNGADWQDTRDGGHGDEILADDSNPWGNAAFAFRQANVEYTNEAGTKVWAGKKYYQRHDIHWLDFYYWNTSGYGGGVENFKINDQLGTLSAAWLRVVTNDGGPSGNEDKVNQYNTNNIDLRWAGIQMWKDASLELGANIYVPTITDEQDKAGLNDDTGTLLTAEYTQGGILGGFNKFTVQYADGASAHELMSNHSGSYFGAWMDKDSSGYRIIDWGVIQLSDKIEMGYNAIYAQVDYKGDNDHKWTSVGIRPVYKWSDTMKSIIEIGYDSTDNPDWGQKEDLTKVTFAQALTAGSSFWARPELRAYVTYAKSDDDNKFREGRDKNISVGLQAEAWW